MFKLLLAILSMGVAFLLTGAFFQRHALACEMLPVINYQQIDKNVYLAPDMAREPAADILELVTAAAERITLVYGAPVSTPRLLITAQTETAEKWGANSTASMHRLPWRACIVVGPKGLNVDVVAHEWLHAEIQQRVGFFRFLTEIPVWFDEGAALTVDYRAPFLPENIVLTDAEVQAVKLLVRGSDFFANDIRTNYQAARRAVEPLIIAEHFYADLERIALGESFDTVFVVNQSTSLNADAVIDY